MASGREEIPDMWEWGKTATHRTNSDDWTATIDKRICIRTIKADNESAGKDERAST
jgi:hypothetical protein